MQSDTPAANAEVTASRDVLLLQSCLPRTDALQVLVAGLKHRTARLPAVLMAYQAFGGLDFGHCCRGGRRAHGLLGSAVARGGKVSAPSTAARELRRGARRMRYVV